MVSDFHLRGGDPYDRDVVLRALVSSVADYRRRGLAPDLIFATGDIAHSGKEHEYKFAAAFFDDLLAAVQLEKSRLFVIPGNHDVDRDFGIGLARTLDSREQADAYFRPELPKPHLTHKLGAFLKWHNEYFEGIRVAPSDSTCGPVELLTINGQALGLLPINSALFCQGDDDHDKLLIGRRCLDSSLAELRKLKCETNIVLIHHPLEWLSAIEGASIQAEIEASLQILLRGHLHETRVESVASPEGQILRCAAGAAYQSRKWPNRALYGTLDGGQLTIYPIRYEDAPREIWTTDPSVFPRENGHRKTFSIFPGLSRSPDPPPPPSHSAPLPRFRSNVTARGNLPFVGRDSLLAQIANVLSDPNVESVVELHGPPGVGKSELAREFARLNRARYSGGVFLIDASTDTVSINLAAIGKNILDLPFRPDLPIDDQALQTFHALGSSPVLLIYDNVISVERIQPWLPFSGMPCQVIITTLADNFSSVWPRIEVKPLSTEHSSELVNKLTGGQLAASSCQAIVEHACGLPVQIIADSTTLSYEQRRGRQPAHLSLAPGATASFEAVYRRLEQPIRLLLHAAALFTTQHILANELSEPLRQALCWSEIDFERTLDDCWDLHLLGTAPELAMHQLFASFLREKLPSPEDRERLQQIRAAQATRFFRLAETLSGNPADAQNAAALMTYPLALTVWASLGELIPERDGSIVGLALSGIGRFDEARSWFERAVAEKEKGDVHGRIDHKSLGISLKAASACLPELGRSGSV